MGNAHPDTENVAQHLSPSFRKYNAPAASCCARIKDKRTEGREGSRQRVQTEIGRDRKGRRGAAPTTIRTDYLCIDLPSSDLILLLAHASSAPSNRRR